MPLEQSEALLSLYILMGEDIFILFHLLRGQVVKFPGVRKFGLVTKKIKGNQTTLIDSNQVVLVNNKVVQVANLKKGQNVLYENEHWTAVQNPVKLCSTWFCLLGKDSL
jgi:hypothetical protein